MSSHPKRSQKVERQALKTVPNTFEAKKSSTGKKSCCFNMSRVQSKLHTTFSEPKSLELAKKFMSRVLSKLQNKPHFEAKKPSAGQKSLFKSTVHCIKLKCTKQCSLKTNERLHNTELHLLDPIGSQYIRGFVTHYIYISVSNNSEPDITRFHWLIHPLTSSRQSTRVE